MPSVVVFGATGLVGAPYIRALKHAHPDWPITAYVRSPKPEAELKATLKADHIVVGNFSDTETIKKLSQENDIVVNAGNSFTGDPITSIIAGQKEKSGREKGKLIHISGCGNFIDFGTSGNFNPDSKVWNDAEENDIKAIHTDMFNGQSDVPVLQAGNVIDTYIVCPSVVYGGASVFASTMGIGYTLLTNSTKTLGYVPYIGEGTAILSTCHVLDLVDFLIKITERSAEGPADGTAYSRYYMLETAKFQWKEIATELAAALHARGLVSDPNPKRVPFTQAGEGEAKHLIAANMLVQGNRATEMGFKAKQPSILIQIHEDLKVIPI